AVFCMVIILKNTINYYYNLSIDNLIKSNNDFHFYLNNQEYHFIKCIRPIEELNSLIHFIK
ncbi:hypothetical protein IKE96_00020, partial [bacterium]|nr:hypothetical protein [bacterium]